eukprot:1112750-Amphidinium_carterae.1
MICGNDLCCASTIRIPNVGGCSNPFPEFVRSVSTRTCRYINIAKLQQFAERLVLHILQVIRRSLFLSCNCMLPCLLSVLLVSSVSKTGSTAGLRAH